MWSFVIYYHYRLWYKENEMDEYTDDVPFDFTLDDEDELVFGDDKWQIIRWTRLTENGCEVAETCRKARRLPPGP